MSSPTSIGSSFDTGPVGAAGLDRPNRGGDRTRPLRVVQLITTLARGGAQATVLASVQPAPTVGQGQPSAAGVDMVVMAGTDRTGEGSFWDDPILDRLRVESVPHLTRPVDPWRDARALAWLIRRFRADRPDVVHTHSSKAGVLGRLAALVAGVPCVHTVHGWGPINAGPGPGRVASIGLERALARLSAALVVVGQGDLEFGLAHRIGHPGQYHLIRSGIELGASGTGPATGEERLALRHQLGLDGRFVVGMVGRMAAQKDQLCLIEAFDRLGLAGATLVLVGDGPRRPALEEAARSRASADVRFLGARPDGARLVTAFDVAVNASHWEGLPRTVVEAAAAGVPVVASDVGGTAELVEPERTGWLVPPGDVEALASAIGQAHDDRPRARALAEAARSRSGQFSADEMRSRLLRLWTETAGRPHPRRHG